MHEPLVSARPLLAPLRELAAAYHEAVARVEALIEALTTGDFAAVQGAIAEQTATAARITRSGRQWEAARDELAVALRAHGLLAADAAPTVSDLLPVLAGPFSFRRGDKKGADDVGYPHVRMCARTGGVRWTSHVVRS